MRLSPILPVGLAVAAVAMSASQGNTLAEPDKRSNHAVVAFPLFALKASDRLVASNNHYSHESHSSHSSHISGGGGHSNHVSHSSHFSSSPSSPAPQPIPSTTTPVQISGSSAPSRSGGSPAAPAGSATAVPAPSGSALLSSGGAPSPVGSFSSEPTGDTSGGGDAAAGVLGVLVVTVGGVSYYVYRRNRRQG
jgi:hypothetical protein